GVRGSARRRGSVALVVVRVHQRIDTDRWAPRRSGRAGVPLPLVGLVVLGGSGAGGMGGVAVVAVPDRLEDDRRGRRHPGRRALDEPSPAHRHGDNAHRGRSRLAGRAAPGAPGGGPLVVRRLGADATGGVGLPVIAGRTATGRRPGENRRRAAVRSLVAAAAPPGPAVV